MMQHTLPDSQEDREVYLREHAATRFAPTVQKTKAEGEVLLMTIGAFAGEPELLYVALQYANYAGVPVTLAPHGTPQAEMTDAGDAPNSFA